MLFTTQAVSEGYLINATLTPGVTVAVSKGIPDAAAANLTPVPSPLTTLVQSPPATLAPVPMNYGAPPASAIPDPALAFFLGGVLVILVLAAYEIYLWKKMKKLRYYPILLLIFQVSHSRDSQIITEYVPKPCNQINAAIHISISPFYDKRRRPRWDAPAADQ